MQRRNVKRFAGWPVLLQRVGSITMVFQKILQRASALMAGSMTKAWWIVREMPIFSSIFFMIIRRICRYIQNGRALRKHKPALLAIWGKNDEIFVAPGALAFKRDLPDAEIHLLDTGHFALETHGDEIALLMLDFLERKVKSWIKVSNKWIRLV